MEAWDSTGAVYSGSYSLPDDVAAAQSDYETRHGAHSRRAGSRRAPMVPALEVFDVSAVCPLRHKGLLCWGAYGSSVGLRATLPKLGAKGPGRTAGKPRTSRRPPAWDWQLRQIGVTNRSLPLWYRAPQVVEEVQYEGHTRRSLGRLCRNREHGYMLAVRRPAAQCAPIR
jgi:hypothetical protein